MLPVPHHLLSPLLTTVNPAGSIRFQQSKYHRCDISSCAGLWLILQISKLVLSGIGIKDDRMELASRHLLDIKFLFFPADFSDQNISDRNISKKSLKVFQLWIVKNIWPPDCAVLHHLHIFSMSVCREESDLPSLSVLLHFHKTPHFVAVWWWSEVRRDLKCRKNTFYFHTDHALSHWPSQPARRRARKLRQYSGLRPGPWAESEGTEPPSVSQERIVGVGVVYAPSVSVLDIVSRIHRTTTDMGIGWLVTGSWAWLRLWM